MNKDDVAGLVERLQKHIFYGDARLFNFKKHSPLAMEAADALTTLSAENERLRAALREVFLHGHSEGWRGNQTRRDVQPVDAKKSWSLYVSNGALSKTIARQALAGDTNHG